MNRFLSLLGNGNEDIEFDYEEESDYDADKDNDGAYNESSDDECKDFLYNHERGNHSLSTADCLLNFMTPFHGGFNCLKATEPLRGGSLLFAT